MNTQYRLLVLGVGLALLAGCQSMDIPPKDAQYDARPEAVPVERTIQVATTLPRPCPPQTEPIALLPQLPEPGLPALPKSLAISEPNPTQYPLGAPVDLPFRPAEPEAPPSSPAAPYVPSGGWEFRLSQPRSPVKAPVLVFAPSSRALAGAERPPAAVVVAPDDASTEALFAAPHREAPGAEAKQAAASPAASPLAAEGSPRVARASTGTTPAPTVSAITAPPIAPAASKALRTQPARQQTDAEPGQGELLARRGDPIAIDLEGSGWIYTGLKSDGVPDTGEPEGIGFISRRSTQDRTSFSFEAQEYGDYELLFQQQDHQQAVSRSQVIRLRVVPEQEFAAALDRLQPAASAQPGGTAEGSQPIPGPLIRSADALFELGEYELALIEYTRNMRSGDPYLNDRLAQCYEHTGEHLAAAKYYRENLGLEGEYGDRAAAGLVRTSIATEDSRLLLEVLPSLFSLESMQIGGELLEVARYQTEDRHLSVAIEALEQYLDRYPDGRNLDEVYYRLACIYEVDSPFRDLEAARHYYGLLYESFPESLYADPAAERLDYLNRHFFLVQ